MVVDYDFNQAIRKRLLQGKLTATGIPEGGGRRCKIEPFQWQNLNFYTLDDGRLVAWREPGVSPKWGFRDIAVKFPRRKI